MDRQEKGERSGKNKIEQSTLDATVSIVLHCVPWPMNTTSYQTKVDIFNLEYIEN